MTAIEVRKWLLNNEKKIPYPIRLERNLGGKPITWVHLDTIYNINNDKIKQFDV